MKLPDAETLAYPGRLMHVLCDIRDEMARQDAKWGSQHNHPPGLWMLILIEEIGEAARAALERNGAQYRKELVECAAVLAQMIMAYDKNPTRVDSRPHGEG